MKKTLQFLLLISLAFANINAVFAQEKEKPLVSSSTGAHSFLDLHNPPIPRFFDKDINGSYVFIMDEVFI